MTESAARATDSLAALPERYPVVIIGGGPAGLTAAFELVSRNIFPIVLEKENRVGGLARTEIFQGYRFDIGGHRFYTQVEEVRRLWQDTLGAQITKVPRLSRIYYRGKFYKYPIEFFDTLRHLGVLEGALIFTSYLRSKISPFPQEETFEHWVSNRFGRRLFRTFFKTYTEKVWGIPCHLIQADWAAQRIRGLSLTTVLSEAVFRNGGIKTLVTEFDYPVLGPGMMWDKFQQTIERGGGRVELGWEVARVNHKGNRVTSVVAQRDEETREIFGEHFLSSMPITELIHRFDPPAPPAVIRAAEHLHYRAFILVALIVNRARVFPDHWIYIHSPEVRVGRIQNFKNWSSAMVPDVQKSSLGLEYFCDEDDVLWNLNDAALILLAKSELRTLGLAHEAEIEDGFVIRQSKAYPVYDAGYREHLQVLREFLSSFENLQTLGRNGMHRYNNQDHSMLTGMLAARNILGEKHDLWNVNTERSYYEDLMV